MCGTQLCHCRQTKSARTFLGGGSQRGHAEQQRNVPGGCEVSQDSAENPRHDAVQCRHPRSSAGGVVCAAQHNRLSHLCGQVIVQPAVVGFDIMHGSPPLTKLRWVQTHQAISDSGFMLMSQTLQIVACMQFYVCGSSQATAASAWHNLGSSPIVKSAAWTARCSDSMQAAKRLAASAGHSPAAASLSSSCRQQPTTCGGTSHQLWCRKSR